MNNLMRFSIFSFVLSSILFVSLSQWAISKREKTILNIHSEVQKDIELMVSKIDAHFLELELGLRVLSSDFQKVEVNKEKWLRNANRLLKDIDGIQAIEWADSNDVVQWVVPLEGNRDAIKLKLDFNQQRRVALQRSRKSGDALITAPINLVQGGKGFLFLKPIYFGNKFKGHVLIVMRTQEMFEVIFEKLKMKEFYNWKLSSSNTIISSSFNEQEVNEFTTQHVFNIKNQKMELRLTPNTIFFSSHRLAHSLAFIFSFAGVLSAIFGFLLFLFRKNLSLVKNLGHKQRLLDKQVLEKKEVSEKLENNTSKVEKLLTELDHRLKNNVQSILSLMELQLLRLGDSESKDELQTAYSRVSMLRIVYKAIDNLNKWEVVSLKEVLNEFVKFQNQRIEDEKTSIQLIQKFDCDSFLNVGEALKVVLIVNELVSNSITHAFKENSKRDKKIEISLMKEFEMIKIKVIDNGTNRGPLIKKLGLVLVENLCNDLHAQFKIDLGIMGTKTEFTFLAPEFYIFDDNRSKYEKNINC